MGYRRITVQAKRKRPLNPERPENEVYLFELDHRHPGGQVTICEGDTVTCYPTPKVQALLGTGNVEQVTDATVIEEAIAKSAPAPVVETADIAPESLFNLELDERIIDAVTAGGFNSIGSVAEAYREGALEQVKGIGKGRLEKIGHALVSAGHLDEDDL